MTIIYSGLPPTPPGFTDAQIETMREDLQEDTIQAIARAVAGQSVSVLSASSFGVTGDGVTDDSPAIQRMLDAASADTDTGAVPNTVILSFPRPAVAYRMETEVTYVGAPDKSLYIKGEIGGNRGPTGVRFDWYGAAAGTMFHLYGANASIVENIELYGRDIAKYCLHLDYWAGNGEYGAVGSSGTILRNVVMANVNGAGSSCLALGDDSNHQVSEVDLYSCVFVGDNTKAESAIKTLSAGNTKNFKVFGGTINGFSKAVDWQNASGVFNVYGTIMANIGGGEADATCFVAGTGVMNLFGVQVESGADLTSARFITGTGGTNHGSVNAEGCLFEGVLPADDFLVDYFGQLSLKACYFNNGRTAGSEPKIKISTPGPGYVGSLNSEGNFYKNAATCITVSDGSNILTNDDYSSLIASSIYSKGDMGGDSGALVKLRPLSPAVSSIPLRMPYVSSGTGITELCNGETRTAHYSVRLAYTAFQVAALTKDIQICRPPPKCKIRHVLMDVRTAFGGTAGTLLLRMGLAANGDDRLMVDSDAKTIALYGDADADLGTSLVRAAAVQAATTPDWAANDYLMLRLTSSSGNLSGLSVGSVDIHIEYTVFP